MAAGIFLEQVISTELGDMIYNKREGMPYQLGIYRTSQMTATGAEYQR